jgi:hypothetical protein
MIFVNGGSAVRPRARFAGTSIAFAGESAYAQILHDTLAAENIYVAQLIIPGAIRPDSPDTSPTIIADKIWELHRQREGFRHCSPAGRRRQVAVVTSIGAGQLEPHCYGFAVIDHLTHLGVEVRERREQHAQAFLRIAGSFGFGQHDLVVIDDRLRQQLRCAIRAVSVDYVVKEGAYQSLTGLSFGWHLCS